MAKKRPSSVPSAPEGFKGLKNLPMNEVDGHFREDHMGKEPFDYAHNPSWRMFRIMAEFADGFTFISKFKKTVTFFGSARFPEGSEDYKKAQKLASLLSKSGYTIISGGGPGIMEAANRGAKEGKGDSVGLNIQLPFEQRINRFVDKGIAFNFFFTRKVMLAFAAEAYIYFPGGFGTLDEMFEILTLRQTHKINPRIPIILVGKRYWGTLCKWIEEVVYKEKQAIAKSDLKLYDLVDTPEEAFAIIKKKRVPRKV